MPKKEEQKVAGEIAPLKSPRLDLTRIVLMPSVEITTGGVNIRATVGRVGVGERAFELASLEAYLLENTELYVETGVSFEGNRATAENAHRVMAIGKGTIGHLDPEHKGPGGIEQGKIVDLSLRFGVQAVFQTGGIGAHVRALTLETKDFKVGLFDAEAGVLKNTRVAVRAMASLSLVSVRANRAHGSLVIAGQDGNPVAVIE